MAVEAPSLPRRLRRFSLSHPDGTALGLLFTITFFLFLKYLQPHTSQVLSDPTGDVARQFVWWREFGFGELKKGHLALWNPHLFCGAPFFAGFQSALLYPPNWIFLFLPLAFALNLSMALHVLLAGWFAYLWIRKRGGHPSSALLAALIYMFSGAFFVSIVAGHLSNLCSMAWIPLVFWALEGWKKERRPRWIAWSALALSLQFFSGHIQYAYYTAMAVGFYSVAVSIRMPRRFQFLGGVAAAYALGFAMASIQLLAGWDAVKESVRGEGMNLFMTDMANLTPERLCTLLMPYFYGTWKDYWGGGFYSEGNLFVTVTGFILALLAWKASKDPERKVFTYMGLLATVLMVGKHTPLFALFCGFFPLFNRFRGVSKLNIILILCLALLAALAHDALLENPAILRVLVKPLGAGGGLFLLAAALFFLAPRMGGARLFRQFLPYAPSMALNLLLTAVFLGVLAFLCVQTLERPALKWGFLVLVFGESLFFASNNLSSFDLQALRQKIAPIQQTYDKDPGDYRVWVDSFDFTLAAPSGLDIWGEDPMMPLRYTRFAVQTQGYDFSTDTLARSFFRRITPPLGLLRLRYLFRDKGGPLEAERLDLKEVPRVFGVDRWEISSEDGILNKVAQPGFQAGTMALLETDPGLAQTPSPFQCKSEMKDLSTDLLEVNAQVSKPCLLVVADNYSRGWKARPAESSTQTAYQVLPVDGFFRGIPLRAGKHHFYLEYRPTAFEAGKWISIVSWIFFFALFAWKKPSL